MVININGKGPLSKPIVADIGRAERLFMPHRTLARLGIKVGTGWIAGLRRDAISATGAAPIPIIPSDYCRAIAMWIASSGETR
jgi:hypothetical protein